MPNSTFNSTVSDMAASLLTESVVDSAKSNNNSGIPIETLDKISPAMLILSATTKDPLRSQQVSPTLILKKHQQENLKKTYQAIRDRIKLGLLGTRLDNRLLSKSIHKHKLEHSKVYKANSRLVLLRAVTTHATRKQLQSMLISNGGNARSIKTLKIPEQLRSQIGALGNALNAIPATQAIAMGKSLDEFWKDRINETKEDGIEGKVKELASNVASETLDRTRKVGESKTEELNAQSALLTSKAQSPEKSDRYASIRNDDSNAINSMDNHLRKDDRERLNNSDIDGPE